MIKRSLMLLLAVSIGSMSLVAMEPQKWDGESFAMNSEIQYSAGKRLFDDILFKETDAVLDLGCCACAKLAADLAQNIVPQGTVTAVDCRQSILEKAIKEYGQICNLMILHQNRAQEHCNGKCDKAISVYYLHWFSSLDAVKEAIKFVANSLKPGGTFYACVMIKDTEEHPNPGIRLAQKVVASEKWSKYFKDLMPFGNSLDLKDYQEALDTAGLEGKVYVPQIPERLITQEQCNSFIHGLPILKAIPEDLLVDFKADLFQAFKSLKNENGFYIIKSSIGMITATKPL